MGGARTHLVGLVPELARFAAPDDRFLLLAQPDLLSALPDLPPSWETRSERAQDRGLLGRFRWEQRALPRLASDWGADVLVSFGAFVPLRASMPRVLEAGNALPFTHAYWLWVQRQPVRLQAEEMLRWLLLSQSLKASSRVLVPTRAMRQDVVTRLPDLAQRIDVVLWGIAESFKQRVWQGAPPVPTIVGVSKHGVNKEFDVLVGAFDRLSERWPNAELLLTGTRDESRWSRETADLARRAGVADRVRWLGDLPNERLPEVLAHASVLVFPTWCESFGLPLAEGMAMGLPSVAADIPACREVGGRGARFYHPGSPKSLADQVAAILADDAEARRLSAEARARGAEFAWRANAEGTYATLRRAAAVRGVA